MSRKAHEHRVVIVTLAHKLADVEFPALAHLRRARIAQMRIVRPENELGALAAPLQVFRQFAERLRHMAVPQIP